jgi:polynucleotide 5'-triphosphatase
MSPRSDRLLAAPALVLLDTSCTRFESNMNDHQHGVFNRLLNARVEDQQNPSWAGAPIRYSHYHEIDFFHPVGDRGGRSKIRVTKDEKTGQIKPGGVIQKTRIADMNIFVPKQAFDFRISINVEEPMSLPQNPPSYQRRKNRVSYQQQMFQIDLTQVKTAEVRAFLPFYTAKKKNHVCQCPGITLYRRT